MRDPFARLVPDRLAEPVGPPVRPWDVAAGGAGEAGPGGTAILPAVDPRLWIKAKVLAQDPVTPGRYAWTEVVSDDAAEPSGWAVPGGAASGTYDARELNDNAGVPPNAIVWLRASDGPAGQRWAWEFAYEGGGLGVLSGCDPPSGVVRAGVFYYQMVCGSGSGSGTGTGTGGVCGTPWVSCGGGCWMPLLTGAPYCPGSGSGPPPAPPGTIEGRILYTDPPDAPAPGVTVQLEQPPGTVIDTFTSDAEGNYLFASKPAGSYVVHVVPPAGKSVAENDRGVTLYESQPGVGGVDFYLSAVLTTACCPTRPIPQNLFVHWTGCAAGLPVWPLNYSVLDSPAGFTRWRTGVKDFTNGAQAEVWLICDEAAHSWQVNFQSNACAISEASTLLSSTCDPAVAISCRTRPVGPCGPCAVAGAQIEFTIAEAP